MGDNKRMPNIIFHLSYEKSLTMGELSAIMVAVESLYKAAYSDVRKTNKDLPKDESVPKIEKITEGSINIDLNLSEIISETVVGLILGGISAISKKIKEHKENKKKAGILDRQSTFIINNSTINIIGNQIDMHVPSMALDICVNHWDEQDEECFSIYAIREYIVQKKNTSPEEFICNLPDFLMRKYGYKSLKMKLQNTKEIFEELQKPNNLNISPLKNYSKRHWDFIKKELK